MYIAFVAETPTGFYAIKLFSENYRDAAKRAKAAYADVIQLHDVRGGKNDDLNCGHGLYDRALALAEKLSREAAAGTQNSHKKSGLEASTLTASVQPAAPAPSQPKGIAALFE